MEIKVAQKMLDANDEMARHNRLLFKEKNVFVINIMSSPGSGKTTLLEKTLGRIQPDINCGIIVGDICTKNDAERILKTGAPAIQINTDAFGGECHLSAGSIEKAASDFNLEEMDLLIVENVGNLVCPAEFDIGEDVRVVVLSVTEGEDKPLKYPLMFRESSLALLNKIDLLPYLDYDIGLTKKYITRINAEMPVIEISSKTLEGFDQWIEWLKNRIIQKK
ncbi:MAG: hydrogenase nickel incorporation protein HypB [Desulfobacterales bacterium]|jgi:hydrogenase nickel incorporation protein HypB|nr:hydrogenase nickel incorporation protein HypB [Desulfobacteraceae bacterium]MBT4363266.1 hydrogenase nickel incorporation protein HypB [Desulfobacteraceae bacterium]MBT7085243.1 hydrogenase nickel incorporation protein HypB [Desulfobacterales bacterium]MBT7696360.1 hydrogenase nickel incorporation protein HypB [Desulfobacterales bacterium]